jgi:Holliday junction resolvase RusA-like endonuclease
MEVVAVLKFTIPLPPVTKKNSQQIIVNKKTGRPMVIPSKRYREYEKECGWFVQGKGMNIKKPVNVKCVYYMPTRRRVDLTNLMEATHDILVKYEVLEDDNSKVIRSVDGSRVLYDKENPRTEITIERAE